MVSDKVWTDIFYTITDSIQICNIFKIFSLYQSFVNSNRTPNWKLKKLNPYTGKNYHKNTTRTFSIAELSWIFHFVCPIDSIVPHADHLTDDFYFNVFSASIQTKGFQVSRFKLQWQLFYMFWYFIILHKQQYYIFDTYIFWFFLIFF